MNKFNLLGEPWLNVRTLEGQSQRLSIRDVLLRAHEITALEDSSPVVLVSLHRLLLAVSHRVCKGPTGLRQLRRLLSADRFDEEQINAYLNAYEDRFYLFGSTPFFQVADLEVAATSVAKLAVERSSGNNKALFDHSLDALPPNLSYDQAARWLVAHQAFSLCGGVSAGGLKNFTDAASPRGAFVLVQGRSLYETLIANLAIYPEDLEDVDAPVWERPPLTVKQLAKGQQEAIRGYADLYTWQSRAVRLIDDGESVSVVHYASGLQPSGWFRDPMLAYQKPKKAEGDNIPVKFSLDRAFWRDFASLVPPEADLRPQVLNQAQDLENHLGSPVSVNVLGQIARPGKPTVDAWRSESYPLPLTLLTDQEKQKRISGGLERADEVRKVLFSAGNVMAKELTEKGDHGKIRDSLPLMNPYWADLELRFADFLTGLAAAPEDAYLTWRDDVKRAAWRAFYLAAASVKGTGSATARKAILAAESKLAKDLNQLFKEVST